MKVKKQKKSIIRRLVKYSLTGMLIACIALIAAYFYLTSEGFLKHRLLPWLGEISGSEYSTETIDVSLWHSTIKMTGVRVGSKDKPFIISDIQLSFSLMKIIQGDLKVDNLMLDNAKVVLRQNSDGIWEIPFGNSGEKTQDQSEAADEADADEDPNKKFPVFLNVSNASIKRIDFLLETADGSRLTVTDGTFTLPKMMNDKLCSFKLTGKLSISAGDEMKVNAEEVTLNGAIRLRPNFMMQRLNLELDMRKFSGAVNKITLAGNELNATLKSYWDDDGIKIEQLHLEEDRNVEDITNINGSGMIGFSPFAIDAAVDFDPVSESLVSLILSFFRGYNPGSIKLKYHGKIHYSAGHIKSAGKFYCRRQGDALIDGITYPIPEFSLNTVHDMEIDFKQAILTVDNFTASLLQNDRQVVGLNIAPTSLGVDDITSHPLATTLTINKLDVGLFQLLFPKRTKFLPKTGQFSTKLKLSGKSFKSLRVEGSADLDDFDFLVETKMYQNLNMHSVLDLNLTNFSMIAVKKWKTIISSAGQRLGELSATQSNFNLKNLRGQANIQLSGINYSTLRKLPLSPQTMQYITEIRPFELKLKILSAIDLKARQLVLNNAVLDIKQRSATNLSLALVEAASFNWDKQQRQRENLKQLRLKISNLNSAIFNTFLRPAKVKFNSGWVNADIAFSLSNLAEVLKVKGRLALYDLDLTIGKRRLRSLQIEQSLDFELDSYHRLELKDLAGKILLARRLLLQYEGSGRLDFSHGKGSMRLYFNCSNPQLVNSFVEDAVEKLALNGNIGIDTGDMFKTALITGKIRLTELMTDKLKQPVSGKAAFRLRKLPGLLRCEQLLLDAFATRKALISLAVRSSAKIIEGRTWENIELKSSRIDLKLLESIMEPKTAPAEEEKPRTEPYRFDFGKQFYLIDTDLRGISYGSAVNGRVKSTIYGIGKKLKISPLQMTMNEHALDISGWLHSLPDGIKYKLAGHGNDINLSPLFQSLISGEMKNSKATIDKVDFYFSGDGIAGNRLWDQLRGDLNLYASDISLPNTIRDTTLGNIMFLPLDGIAKFQKFMPLNLLQSSLRPSYYTDMFKTVKDFKFSNGIIRARAKDRLIYVDECKFIGPLIRKLQFEGWFGLGSEDKIKLKSSLDLLYLTLNLGIVGTRNNPRLELVKFIPQAIGTNVIKVFDPRNIPAIFKDVQDEWNNTIGKKKTDDSKSQPSGQQKKTVSPAKTEEQLGKELEQAFDHLKNILN
ncbi:MAG: hypothetical protein L3J71_05695 [Victivallaceae bacterium]|nr:hypothetical protein [Victivallaceae bacterium]